MATIILGQTLVFWSGIAAGIAFAISLCTCRCVLESGYFPFQRLKARLAASHTKIMRISAATVAAHILLGLLASIFGIWP